MNKNGHNVLVTHINDLIYCGLPSTILNSYQFLLDLLQELGLDISLKKLVHLILRSCALVCCFILSIELCPFLIINSRKFVKYVMNGEIREWSLK